MAKSEVSGTAKTARPSPRGARRRVDLLITDVIMPKMNGWDLAQRLRSLLPSVAVMFMSGYPADIIARQGVIEGGVVFLEKPFTQHQLAQKVREALEQTRLH